MTGATGSTQDSTSVVERLAAYGAISALASGVIAALGTVFLLLFFTFEAPEIVSGGTEQWTPLGRTNDALIGLAALAAIPVAFRLHQSWRTRAASASSVTLAVGVISLVGVGLVQLPFAVGLIGSAVAGPLVTVGLGGLGVWVLLVSLGRADPALRGGPRWIGVATGVGDILLPIGFFAAGGSNAIAGAEAVFQSPGLIVAFTASILGGQIGYPIWAIWLGRRLRAGSAHA